MSNYVNLTRVLALVAMLFLGRPVAVDAQTIPSGNADLNRLENNIKQKETLAQAKAELQAIYSKAQSAGDDLLQARSLNYLIVVRDQLSEDTLYFKNSAVIDTLLLSPKTSPKLKSLLYAIQSRRIMGFNEMPRRFNAVLYGLKNVLNNYAALTNQQRAELSNKLLDSALINSALFTQAEGAQLKWLSSTPDVFLFEPKLDDILLAEKVNRVIYNNRYNEDINNTIVELLSVSHQDFRTRLNNIQILNLNDQTKAILNTYKNWMDLHRNDEATSSFIESLARKSLYTIVGADSIARVAYTKYLSDNINSRYDIVKAHTIYQLCLLWNQDGNKYKDFKENYRYWAMNSMQPFNAQYQFLPAKALSLYEQNSILIEKYPTFKQVLDVMAKQIKAKGMRVEMGDTHLPDSAIPLKATYKNTDTLFYKVVKMPAMQPAGKTVVIATEALLKEPAALSGNFILPLPADHNVHSTYLKLDKLPVGRYKLLFSYNTIGAIGDTLNSLCFNVSNIIAVNTDDHVFVLDRKAGRPLTGAGIRAFKKRVEVKSNIDKRVRPDGYALIKKDIADSLSITYKGDTLGYDIKVTSGTGNQNVFDKEEFEDLNEFYEDKLQMEIFTDRAIYRPGQTVQYKIILLTRHPLTGETILFNKQNLGGGLFKTRLKKWLAEDDNDLIVLRNTFNKAVDSLRITINEFGSFAGSFTLPKTAATGNWRIDGDINANYQNDGSFKVEEYKRPTIDMTMEKQKKVFLPGDPFVVKLKLRSFNGSDLSNIPVKYTLERRGSLPLEGNSKSEYTTKELVDTTAYTNAAGELLITFNDTTLARLNLSDDRTWSYDYEIEANAVDPTGESVEINETIEVSSRPVNVNLNMPAVLNMQELPQLMVRTSDKFAGDQASKVNVKVYQTGDPDQRSVKIQEVDQWYYPQNEWYKWFPGKEVNENAVERKLVLDTLINTADAGTFKLNKEKLQVGFYQIIASTLNGDRTIGLRTQNFNVFDSKAGQWAGEDLNYMPFNFANKGAQINWYTSGNVDDFGIYRVAYSNAAGKSIVRYVARPEKAGIKQWRYKLPDDITGRALLTRIAVSNNDIHYAEQTVYINSNEKINPQIIVERYRRTMAPGAEEKFSVTVKTQNDNIAAELLTTLYDASLDKLEEHKWQLPGADYYQPYQQANWNRSAFAFVTAETVSKDMTPVNLFKLSEIDLENGIYGYSSAGLSLANARGLEEVVVVGYGALKRVSIMGSVSGVNIVADSAIDDILKKLPGLEVDAAGNVITLGKTVTNVRISGKDYVGGDVSALKSLPADIVERIQVVDDYGDQAGLMGIKGPMDARKVLNFTLSADGSMINVLLEPLEPVIKIRKNFNETAFFFPQVHADADGFYTFSFTMPETATEWNWKMLAHTRDARFAYLERKLQTQLNLMVQPNMPRVLYQSDKIKLQSRISNLDTLTVQGKATCKIEDAVTGQDITKLLTTAAEVEFKVDKKSNGAVAFILNVPAQQTNPLKIIITATAGNAADAEEHIIPVLSSKVFIRQSVPVRFDDKAAVSKPKMPVSAEAYGLSLSITQKPQAALINALPWLANYSFDCAEQTFNKLRAQVTALTLMQKDTSAQNSFKRYKGNTDQTPAAISALPDELADETMPWLKLAANTSTQQKQLFNLLDTTLTKAGIEKHIQRLQKLQKPDGGLTWFDGGESNPYISAYVLAGFGQLKQMNYAPKQSSFIAQLVKYNQNNLTQEDAGQVDKLQTLYALSYFLKEHPLAEDNIVKVKKYLQTGWSAINTMGLQQQAQLIICTMRYMPAADALHAKAVQQLENLRQMAINDVNGMRWKAISNSESMNTSAEETMALLAEAFAQSGKYTDVQSGIIKWLLTAKQQEHWQTTTATAAAINMLQKEKGSAIGSNKVLNAEVAGKQLQVSDDLVNGTPAAFLTTANFPEVITLKDNGSKASGAITWYYFAQPEALDTLNKAVRIKREFFIYGDNSSVQLLQPGATLKPGDKLRVKLTVETATALQYVHINDPRAALFEPKDAKSGYRYANGAGYYQSVRDTGIELFVEAVPRGATEFTYDMQVAHSGQFNNGPATLQCMYQPAVTAYSNTQSFKAD